MEIKEMQTEVMKFINDFNKARGLTHHPESTFHHLIEEVGELGREISKDINDWRNEGFDKQKLAKEINDVICQCLVLADDYDVDLDETFKNKMKEWKRRYDIK